MATDGVKIIDGDLAHDVYHIFMDLYDAGKPIAEIKADIEQLRPGNDEFYDEIFITAYALALWDIGEITPDIIREVKQAIERGAFVKYLVEWHNGKESKQRQRVLDRFWQKITQVNPRVRKRKNYKIQKEFAFKEGDVLTFQLVPDDIYCVAILLLIDQHRGRTSYYFIMHSYVGSTKPDMNEILNGKIIGSPAIPGSIGQCVGFKAIGVDHSKLLRFSERFKSIGKLPIRQEAKCLGTQGGADSFESFTGDFRYLQQGVMPYRAKYYSVKNLL